MTSKGGIEGYFAEKYDKFAKAILIDLYKEIAGLVIKHLKSEKILEIGPGPGYLSIEIAKKNAQEAGADVVFKQ